MFNLSFPLLISHTYTYIFSPFWKSFYWFLFSYLFALRDFSSLSSTGWFHVPRQVRILCLFCPIDNHEPLWPWVDEKFDKVVPNGISDRVSSSSSYKHLIHSLVYLPFYLGLGSPSEGKSLRCSPPVLVRWIETEDRHSPTTLEFLQSTQREKEIVYLPWEEMFYPTTVVEGGSWNHSQSTWWYRFTKVMTDHESFKSYVQRSK